MMMNILLGCKRLTAFVVLLVALMFCNSPQLRAQCGDGSTPTISIGHLCLSPGNSGSIDVRGIDFNAILSWKIAICYTEHPAFTIMSVSDLYPGVTVNWDQNNNQFTFEYAPGGNCQVPGAASFQPDELFATIQIMANQGQGLSGTLFMTMCQIATNEPSHFVECQGLNAIPGTPGDCVGGASLADPMITVTGEIHDMMGREVPNVPVGNSATTDADVTGANGGYSLNDIIVNGLPSVSVFPTPGGINININGITTFDVVPIIAHLGEVSDSSLTCLQLIAADGDGDGIISELDVDAILYAVQVKQGPHLEVGNWVFVPEGYNLSCQEFDRDVPTGFPTSVTFTGFCDDYYTGNFIAVHVGDLVDGPDPVEKHNNALRDTDATRMVQLVENPFRAAAVMDMNFPTDAPATIRVFDGQGKLLHVSSHVLSDGQGQVRLDASTWPAGMLMFQVQAGNDRYAGRLLHLR